MKEPICHLDSRNWDKVKDLAFIFSDFSLNKQRLFVELEYLKALSKVGVVRRLKLKETKLLDSLYNSFNEKEFKKVKRIEKKINHDIKALEYYLIDKIASSSLKDLASYIHFCLCSADINNLAYGLMLKRAKKEVVISRLKKIISLLKGLSKRTALYVMLGRTHGQPASPTTFGKEVIVFVKRLEKQLDLLKGIEIEGKLTGSVGNFNAHVFVKPKINWLVFSKRFVKGLGLKPNLYTNQMLAYDSWIEIFDCIKRINNILLGLVEDFWWYTSLGYLKLKLIKKEVGSSTMPHKLNPIDLEAAEGNLGFSNAMLSFFSDKLAKTRLQRDLSDSTVRRNIGLGLAYSYFAWDSILRALSRLKADKKTMLKDLKNNPQVLAEAVQYMEKTKGKNKAYEELKSLTRGKKITYQTLKKYIKIDQRSYTGLAEKLVKKGLK